MFVIVFSTLWMRSPVGGCVEKRFDMEPGLAFSFACNFSKKATMALGS